MPNALHAFFPKLNLNKLICEFSRPDLPEEVLLDLGNSIFLSVASHFAPPPKHEKS